MSDTMERTYVYTTADAPDRWREQLAALADAIEALQRVVRETSPELERELWRDATRAQGGLTNSLVNRMGRYGLLGGVTMYDECGRALATILRVERIPETDEAWVVTDPRRAGGYLAELANDCSLEQYIGLPGTKAYGVEAVVELARERAA